MEFKLFGGLGSAVSEDGTEISLNAANDDHRGAEVSLGSYAGHGVEVRFHYYFAHKHIDLFDDNSRKKKYRIFIAIIVDWSELRRKFEENYEQKTRSTPSSTVINSVKNDVEAGIRFIVGEGRRSRPEISDAIVMLTGTDDCHRRLAEIKQKEGIKATWPDAVTWRRLLVGMSRFGAIQKPPGVQPDKHATDDHSTSERPNSALGFRAPPGWGFKLGGEPGSGSICWGDRNGWFSILVAPKGVDFAIQEYGRIYPLSPQGQTVVWAAGQWSLRLAMRELAHQSLFCNLQPGQDPNALVPRLIARTSRMTIFDLAGTAQWTLVVQPVPREIETSFARLFQRA